MENKKIREQMELEQKRAFCKQSCTKIDQGLNRLDSRSGERAIWELFQNARDLARKDDNGDGRAHIKVILTPTEFIFTHQGRPFDHDSLSSLVMQVSSQSKENEDTVGQYGTGFLTTHAFGRKLYVTGSLDLSAYSENTYVNIDRFTIDRTYKDIPEFVDKVARQLVAVNDFADAEKCFECRQWTELCYDLSSMEGAMETASSAISAAVDLTPYVMTINRAIESVVLENQMTRDVYEFRKKQLPDEDGLKVMQVIVDHNGVTNIRKIYYLESEDGEDIAILPLKSSTEAKSLNGIAKLFVYFPLLGTETFGMDVIFHSKKFIPVEERDGLHLPVTNANVRVKYEQNVRVLNALTEMVFEYYREHADAISGWVNVSGLTFDCEHHKEDVTKKYFREFKEKWSEFYQNLPIIDFDKIRVSLNNSDVRFFAPEIVTDFDSETENTQSKLALLYNAASIGSNLVGIDEILSWSKVIATWDYYHPTLIDLEYIAKSISNADYVSVDILRAFDTYLSEKKLVSLFDSYALIPNRAGKKMRKPELRNASTIPNWLSDIAEGLISDKTESFADDSFCSIVEMTPFTRNELCDSITSMLRVLRQNSLDKGEMYDDQTINTLLELSSVYPSLTGATVRRKTIDIIAHKLKNEVSFRILPHLDSNERDVAALPFKHLVECILLEISQKDSEWVAENIDYVLALHSSLCSWTEYYNQNTKDGLSTKYGAYPNRNLQPCMSRDLKRGIDIPSELANLYEEVLNKDLNDSLVDERFEMMFDFSKLTAKEVATEIELSLEEGKYQHPAVLDIINNLNEGSVWNQWFPRIASKKAELFLGRVHDDCKESVFKLMKINDPDKLKHLAELADEIDLHEIISKGKLAIIEKKNQEAEFKFKLTLGEYVEQMIQQYLADSVSMSTITVEQECFGCDLSICKDGKPLYYIEVKSRWGANQSVMMSPLQMRTSVEENGNYALCCVDMSHSELSDAEERVYPLLDEVLPHIKVLTEIGSLNKEVCMIADGAEERDVYISGDYKCVIPQSTIQKRGADFTSLIDHIAHMLIGAK